MSKQFNMTEHYELLYIVPIKFLDDDLQKVTEQVDVLIKKFNGEITKQDNLGKQRLSYAINYVHQGTYILVEYDMDKANNKQLDDQLLLMPEVLRHMIVCRKVKTEAEVKRQEMIKEGMRKSKEEELAEIEEKEKDGVKKDDLLKVESSKPVVAKEKEKSTKATLEDLDKKLDEILTDDIL